MAPQQQHPQSLQLFPTAGEVQPMEWCQPWGCKAPPAFGGKQQAISGFSCSLQGFAGTEVWLGMAQMSFHMHKTVLGNTAALYLMQIVCAPHSQSEHSKHYLTNWIQFLSSLTSIKILTPANFLNKLCTLE